MDEQVSSRHGIERNGERAAVPRQPRGSAAFLAGQQGELRLNPIGGALQGGVEHFLYLWLRDHVRSLPPVGDGANGNAQVISERFVGHAQRLPQSVRLSARP